MPHFRGRRRSLKTRFPVFGAKILTRWGSPVGLVPSIPFLNSPFCPGMAEIDGMAGNGWKLLEFARVCAVMALGPKYEWI